MKCPYCPVNTEMPELKYSYHKTSGRALQPINDILSVQYGCPECGTTVETSQQVRITPPKKEG